MDNASCSSEVKIEKSDEDIDEVEHLAETEELHIESLDTEETHCVVMATSMNIKPPTFISDTKTYE